MTPPPSIRGLPLPPPLRCRPIAPIFRVPKNIQKPGPSFQVQFLKRVRCAWSYRSSAELPIRTLKNKMKFTINIKQNTQYILEMTKHENIKSEISFGGGLVQLYHPPMSYTFHWNLFSVLTLSPPDFDPIFFPGSANLIVVLILSGGGLMARSPGY